MKAFIECLAGVIRVGPDCSEYGKPYELAAAFSSSDGKTAVIKGLVSDGKLTFRHYRAAIKAFRAIGLEVRWERLHTE